MNKNRECKYIDLSDWMKHVEIAVEEQLYFVSDQVYELIKKRITEEGKLVEVEDIKIHKEVWEWDDVNHPFYSMYKVRCVIKGCIWTKQIFIIFI